MTKKVIREEMPEQEAPDLSYMYILKCADGTLYTGWTNHLEKRLAAHNSGKGAKYTRTRRPVELVYCEAFTTKQEAMTREYEVKHLTRREKLKLIENVTQQKSSRAVSRAIDAGRWESAF